MPNAPRPASREGWQRRRGLVAGLAVGAFALLSAAARPLPPTDAPVADAAMRRDTARVRLLLKQGADVNAAQGDGMTALHWSASAGNADQVRMLIYAGARLEAATRNGNYTPLHLASKAGNAAVAKALLDAGANANAVTTSGGATPLHLATIEGNKETIAVLIAHGANVNARDGAWGETPLMWAAAYDRVAALEALVAHGAEVGASSKVENIPERERADRAAQGLRNRRVAALKAAEQPPAAPAGRGAPPPAGRGGGAGFGRGGEPASGYPAPKDSAAAKDSMTARPSPADSSKAGVRGDSAKARPMGRPAAADSGRAAAKPAARDSGRAVAGAPGAGDTARAGRGRGAAPDSQVAGGGRGRAGGAGLSYGDLVGNKGGLTPLLFAARQGNVASATALLAAGADIGQASAGDRTSPLLMAVINGHFDLAMMFLSRGASPNQMSDAGATPLYAALNVQWSAKSLYPQPTAYAQEKTTYLDLMRALLDAGADVNTRLRKHLWYMSYNFDLLGVNTTGATPFWRAAYGTDVAAMKLLISYGADPSIPTIKPAGRPRGDDAPAEDDSSAKDPSGLAPIPAGGPGVYPIHAASGVGYGEGYAANSHRHAPDGWLPSMKYLIEVLHLDPNGRDHNGYNALHHAAARGDNQLMEYLVSKGVDITALSRRGQTVADMANGPVQRVPPFLETVALAEKLGSKNSHKCKSC